MKIRNFIALSAILVSAGGALAQTPTTLNEAKKLSARQGKPILIEFFRED